MKDFQTGTDATNVTPADEAAENKGVSRRGFLTLTGAGLFLPMAFGVTHRAEAATATPKMIGAYIRVAPDNTVTVVVGSTEMGQGIVTGIAQVVASELDLNWAQVRAEHAPASALWPNPYGNPIFGAQLTGGSTSMRGWYGPMRTAAAIVRDVFLAAAAQKLGGTWTLGTGGMVTDGTTTQEFSALLDVAATISPSTTATPTNSMKFVGKTMQRLDIPSKVNGSAVFGMDVRVPGMLHASVAHPPVFGATVKTMPTAPAGTTLVNLGDAVGVIASDTWSAIRAARTVASRTTWNLPASTDSMDSAKLDALGHTLLTSTSVTPFVGDKAGTPNPGAGAAQVDATYSLPFLAHATMEVLNCTASVTADSCEIWAPTQGQQFVLPTAAALTGLSPDKITVHTTFLGGGFGRKIETDYVAHAIKCSKAMGAPVKVTWSRESDFSHDMYRPKAMMRVRASASSTGEISQFIYRNVSASINLQRGYTNSANPEDTGALAGALDLAYGIPNRQVEFVALAPCDVPLGYWRSVGEGYNTFAVECAVDELALAAGKDPMAFRKASVSGTTGDPRALGVLNAVAKMSNWGTAPAAGRARGVALLKGFGSYVALVAEVGKTAAGEMRPLQFFAAIDCGVCVNPGQVQFQLQGGVLHGMSAALWHEQTFTAGAAKVRNFDMYPVVKLDSAPPVTVAVVESSAAPGGVGETGVPCVAPALANAWAKLTGTRLRTLPFYPGRTIGEGSVSQGGTSDQAKAARSEQGTDRRSRSSSQTSKKPQTKRITFQTKRKT